MKSKLNKAFRKRFEELPVEAQKIAVECYEKWLANHYHPSLEFKRLAGTKHKRIHAIRVGLNWRALGAYAPENDTIDWFWIGSHEAYNQLVKRL